MRWKPRSPAATTLPEPPAVERLGKIAKGSKSKAVRTYIQSLFDKGAGDVVDSIAGSPEVVR